MGEPTPRSGSEYEHHLESLQARFGAALTASRHDAALVYSGLLLPAFRDDQSYPFRAQAWYCIWGPLPPAPDCFIYVNPGSRPRLLICAPADFWYQQQGSPTGEWTRHFDIEVVESLAAVRAALPQNLSRVALIGAPARHWRTGAWRRKTRKICCWRWISRVPRRPPTSGRCCGSRTGWGPAAT